ncbi:MAG: acyl carrier protein [Tissierellia bacterium]|nr:acyl carrier protein [Bacillota bacterium]NLK58663.1 acyl carrier protein [Tissierellia bacterium]
MTVDKVITIVAEQLGQDASEITAETSLQDDLGADSLDAVEIIMALEDEFDIEISDEEAQTFNNIGEIAQYIDGQLE